MLNTDYV